MPSFTVEVENEVPINTQNVASEARETDPMPQGNMTVYDICTSCCTTTTTNNMHMTILASVATAIITALLTAITSVAIHVAVCKYHPKFKTVRPAASTPSDHVYAQVDENEVSKGDPVYSIVGDLEEKSVVTIEDNEAYGVFK